MALNLLLPGSAVGARRTFLSQQSRLWPLERSATPAMQTGDDREPRPRRHQGHGEHDYQAMPRQAVLRHRQARISSSMCCRRWETHWLASGRLSDGGSSAASRSSNFLSCALHEPENRRPRGSDSMSWAENQTAGRFCPACCLRTLRFSCSSRIAFFIVEAAYRIQSSFIAASTKAIISSGGG
jgi:hypothetical protein